MENIDVVADLDIFDVGIIEKARGKDEDNDEWLMYGWASTPCKDADDEVVIQKGLNLKPLLERGWVNLEHDRRKVIGYPTVADLRRHPDTNKLSMYVEYMLLKGMKDAEYVYELAKALEKSNAPRKLGLSIEGQRKKVSPRGAVLAADVYGFAVTTYAKNPETTTTVLMKSMLDGNDSDICADIFCPQGTTIKISDYCKSMSEAIATGITKALSAGTDIGGTTQTGGGATRKEVIDSDVQYIECPKGVLSIAKGCPSALKKYKKAVNYLENSAKRRGGKITQGEAALAIYLLSGQSIEKCLLAVNL